jgi:hypothetical protein
MRDVAAVMGETVDISTGKVAFATVVEALNAFMERWRVEDATKPPVTTPVGPTVPGSPTPP